MPSGWFDGIIDGFPTAEDCPLCGIEPNACAGLLSGGVTLHIGPQRAARNLSPVAERLSERCRAERPRAWPLFHTELAAFEALHGPWRGNIDNAWTILRRTCVAAVLASLDGGAEGGVHRLAHPPMPAQRPRETAGMRSHHGNHAVLTLT